MSYRKLSKEEVAKLLGTNPKKHREIVAFVKQYYPRTAVRAVISINSEYDDCNYNNHVSYVEVLDAQGNEVLPLKDKAKECRQQWCDLDISGVTGETSEPQDDITVYLDDNLPELYVKE